MDLPLDILHWTLALAPIVVLLIMLVGLRWTAPQAGAVGMFVAALIAILAFQTPAETLAVAGGKGIWDAIFILYVVWPALLLYRVTERAGAFQALRVGIQKFSNNELFLVLGFSWVFASFLQGIAGFGTPIAVVAPLLLAIGVRPIYAVALPLIGHAWANMFGTLAVGWLATLTVVDLQDLTETAFQTAILLWVPNLLSGIAIAWLYGRGKAVMHALPFIVIMTLIHGGGQLALTLWDPVLSNFLAASAGLIALYPLSLWKRYSEPKEFDKVYVMEEDRSSKEESEEEDVEPVMGFTMAGMPYIVLTIAAVVALVPAPIEEALDQFEVGLPFPAVETGYDVEREAEAPYSPFAPLTHPGTFLLISALVAFFVYRARGFYDEWSKASEEESGEQQKGIWSSLIGDAIPASIAVIAFLVMSTLMDHSGQIEVLALGIAEVAPPVAFMFASNWIGVLGAFMTSSNTASNILFAPLQAETVQAVGVLQEPTIIGAQSVGGAIGNAIAPANVVLGTGTAGIVGREGEVLRKTLPYALLAAALVGVLTIVLNGMSFT